DQPLAGRGRGRARRRGGHVGGGDVRSRRSARGGRAPAPRALDRRPPAGRARGHRRRAPHAARRAPPAHRLARAAPEPALAGRARGARRSARPAGAAARGGRVTALRAVGARTFTSLRIHRNYRLFFSGQIISLVGTWMQNTALAWLVVDLTHSPVAVGFLAFCRFVPFSVFGLVAGVVADRFDNRRLVMTTQAFQMAVSVALAVLAFSGQATVWEAYALAVLGGTGLVFDAPGRNSLTYQMVGRDELPNAIALNASLFNASRVIGPAVAGLAIAATSIGVCFALNAISFLAVLAALWLMRTEELYPVERKERPTVVEGTREGLRYVRGAPRVRAVLVMTLVVSTV